VAAGSPEVVPAEAASAWHPESLPLFTAAFIIGLRLAGLSASRSLLLPMGLLAVCSILLLLRRPRGPLLWLVMLSVAAILGVTGQMV